jgi:hypothetical protein
MYGVTMHVTAALCIYGLWRNVFVHARQTSFMGGDHACDSSSVYLHVFIINKQREDSLHE